MKISNAKLATAMIHADIKTYSELAERAKLPRQTVSSIKNGRGAQIETLAKLSAALGVDPAEIIQEDTP